VGSVVEAASLLLMGYGNHDQPSERGKIPTPKRFMVVIQKI
jgi:hypothetical protein